MNITVNRAVIEQALEVLQEATTYTSSEVWLYSMKRDCERAITALRAALEKPEQEESIKRPVESDYTSHVAYTRALEKYCDGLEQPEQEPVREVWCGCGDSIMPDSGAKCGNCLAAEARLPLTDEEILTYRYMIDWTAEWSYINFARAIEAAHGIREPI